MFTVLTGKAPGYDIYICETQEAEALQETEAQKDRFPQSHIASKRPSLFDSASCNDKPVLWLLE